MNFEKSRISCRAPNSFFLTSKRRRYNVSDCSGRFKKHRRVLREQIACWPVAKLGSLNVSGAWGSEAGQGRGQEGVGIDDESVARLQREARNAL